MSHTTNEICRIRDRHQAFKTDEQVLFFGEDLPPLDWGAWTDEAIDSIPDESLDRLDARDEAEVV